VTGPQANRETETEGLAALSHRFGSGAVTPPQRARFVRELFDRIAPRYDLMNDLMSLGLHRLWKRTMVNAAADAMMDLEGDIIDLAGGTGDIAALLRARLPDQSITIADTSPGMLAVARKRLGDTVAYVETPAEALPFASQQAALVTLAFGLRNMTDPARVLAEVARVLKPGGCLLLLEFSRASAWFNPAYQLHSRFVIPALGAAVAGDRRAYRYLIESIRQFPDAASISAELVAAGFGAIAVRRFMFGVAALHSARKL